VPPDVPSSQPDCFCGDAWQAMLSDLEPHAGQILERFCIREIIRLVSDRVTSHVNACLCSRLYFLLLCNFCMQAGASACCTRPGPDSLGVCCTSWLSSRLVYLQHHNRHHVTICCTHCMHHGLATRHSHLTPAKNEGIDIDNVGPIVEGIINQQMIFVYL